MHLSLILRDIILVAIGINVYLWNDEIAPTPPLASTSKGPSETSNLSKRSDLQ